VTAASKSKRRRRAAIGNDAVIPVARSAGRDPIAGHRNSGPGRGLPRQAVSRGRGDEAHTGTPSQRVRRGFPPIIDRATQTLILGSFPSAASLAARQYYAHPRNQFWRLLGALLDEPLAELAYAERGARVLAHRVGIWDVLGACRRPGSLDADISDARPNDFALLRRRAPSLRRVLFNGAAAGRYAAQFIAAGFTTGILPSSSPAHASRSYEQKLALWRAAFAAPAAASAERR